MTSSTRARRRGLLVVIGVLATGLVVSVASGSLRTWTRAEEPRTATPSAPVQDTSELPELQGPLSERLAAGLRASFELGDALGRALVRDALEPARASAAELAAAIEGLEDLATAEEVARTLELARASAAAVADADSLDEARVLLGELNRVLFHLAAHADDARRGFHVFRCPMAPGFQLWFQASDAIANPYMGTSMPTCGVRSDWPLEGASSASRDAVAVGAAEIAYWTCSMHPSVRGEERDTCPICAMNLTPVTVQERDEGLLLVDEHRRQLINLRTSRVARAPLLVPVHGYAEVTVAEPLRRAVNLRVDGWIQELHVDEPGQLVEEGEPLFTLYSPELYSAQSELLAARADESGELLSRSRERLRLLALTDEQIDAVLERGEAASVVEILAPRSGFLARTAVIEGERAAKGATVMEIAGLDPVWVEVEVFEGDAALLDVGTEVRVELSNVPDTRFSAAIELVHPTIDRARRTARVRLVVPNADHALRPGMHGGADVELDLGERLLVPREAVVYTGPRRIVFLDIGEGRLLPRTIEIGHATATHFEVLAGLEEGDLIVSSGTFLIASESRIRSAETVWSPDDESD